MIEKIPIGTYLPTGTGMRAGRGLLPIKAFREEFRSIRSEFNTEAAAKNDTDSETTWCYPIIDRKLRQLKITEFLALGNGGI